MTKVILYIAVSLDGYIADTNGAIDWLGGHGEMDTDYGYGDFIKQIGTIIIGGNTYRQITTELSQQWPYPEQECYILSRRSYADQNKLHFVQTEPLELLTQLKAAPASGDIWICGGSEIIDYFRQTNVIDEYHISLMPIILGGGIPLFNDGPTIPLTLLSVETINGVVNLRYARR